VTYSVAHCGGLVVQFIARRCRSLATLSETDRQHAGVPGRGVRHLTSNDVSLNHVMAGRPVDTVCRRLAGLTRRQRRVCRRNVEIMVGVKNGAQLAIDECQHQFRHRRWNCSVVDRVNVFGKVVTAGMQTYFYLLRLSV